MQIIIKEISLDELVECMVNVAKNYTYLLTNISYDKSNQDNLRKQLLEELSKEKKS